MQDVVDTPIPTPERTVIVRAAPQGSVTVSVRERIENGNVSEPVSITFTPYSKIPAVKAEGEIVVTSVHYEEAAG